MAIESTVLKLESNPKVVYENVSRILIKIADNILKQPNDLKLRTLQKTNATISQKVLAAAGGLECLKIMGFIENGNNLVLPNDVPLSTIQLVRDLIDKRKKGQDINVSNTENVIVEDVPLHVDESHGSEKPISRIVLPPLISVFQNPFLHQIETHFHEALIYENKELQARAKNLIPLASLELKAQENLRNIQAKIKKGDLSDMEISIQDTLILELLSWFKGSFFEWVDSPDCEHCGAQTSMSHMSTDSDLLVYTNRVEMHICSSCKKYTPFPRYNDLNILMETRRGRCGEWANVFTLFCRALGWDARHVVDQTDHVWTEVYSFTQKRWLHCDPCEEACDTPLIYETGWGKTLSYIIAYSGEEVQDVTWRYSCNHNDVLSRRKECSEEELVQALIKLRTERQKAFSYARRQYLTKRLLLELVELMQERQPKDAELQGRISGSEAWRLARGETHDDEVGHIWDISECDIVTVRYASSVDQYEKVCGSNKITKKGWSSGVFEQEGLFRKEEKDWKMSYLARKESVNLGRIKWKFQIKNNQKVIDKVKLNFNHAVFESGQIKVFVTGAKVTLPLSNNGNLETDMFSGSTSLEIEARLSGGNGNVAWQHAQLFRQQTDSEEFPFSITFTLTNV